MFVCTAQEWDPKDAAPQPTPEIDTLVLLDRSVDTVTPLVTPLTYEGLINELIGITNGYVKLDADVAEGGETGAPGGSSGASPQPLEQQQQQRKKLVAVPLNSNDALYARIRDLNVEQLGPFLQGKVCSS
jgi:vacuolar protein sorting-associated protein 33A